MKFSECLRQYDLNLLGKYLALSDYILLKSLANRNAEYKRKTSFYLSILTIDVKNYEN